MPKQVDHGTGGSGCACAPAPETASCCAPAGGRTGPVTARIAPAAETRRRQLRDAACRIPGGRAEIGTDRPMIPTDGEGPRRFVPVKPFAMGAMAVTNADFAALVEDTGYVTDAERFGWSFVFHGHIVGAGETDAVAGTEWWRSVDGACWKRPYGPGSSIQDRGDYPAVHVSWNDATAFARWAGGRLPTEAEWEHAARGGLRNAIYPWGDRHPDDDGFQPCNIWQGRFPDLDLGKDGYRGLAPARSFEPNGYGLYNMCGNCWEWTADAFRVRSLRSGAKRINEQARAANAKLLKGGSHLCHASYCHRYRIAARSGNTPDSTSSHMGFRLVFDL